MVQYLFIPLVAVLMLIVLSNWSSQSRCTVCHEFDGHEKLFRVSLRIWITVTVIGLLFSCFGIAGFVFAPVANVFLLFLGGLLAIMCFFEAWRMSKAKVILTDSHLIYYAGVGAADKRVELTSIKSAVRANGSVIVDTGAIPRLVIPAYFAEIDYLVEFLRTNASDIEQPINTVP